MNSLEYLRIFNYVVTQEDATQVFLSLLFFFFFSGEKGLGNIIQNIH